MTSSNGNSPLFINTTDLNGSVNPAGAVPEDPEELDTRVTNKSLIGPEAALMVAVTKLARGESIVDRLDVKFHTY